MQKQFKLLILLLLSVIISISCSKKKNNGEAIPAPQSLEYKPNKVEVIVGVSATSSEPTIVSPEDVKWRITSAPDSKEINIDDKGIISSTDQLPLGTYVITVFVSNGGGEAEFKNAFTIIVSEPVVPTKLEYPATSTGGTINTVSMIRGQVNVATAVPTTKGPMLTFSIIKTEPTDIKTYLDISPTTGVISIIDSKIPANTYKITVEASNPLGKITSVITLEVKPSVPPSNLKYAPNVSDPAKTPEGGTINSPIPTWDKVDGYTYEFKITSAANPNIKIDAATGVLTILPDLAKGDYAIDVSVDNKIDAPIKYTAAYTFKIGDPAAPTTLTYDPNGFTFVKGDNKFPANKPVTDGTKLTYTIKNVASASGMNDNNGSIGITDMNVGKIVLTDYINIKPDIYTATVEAKNGKGTITANVVIEVKALIPIANLKYTGVPTQVNFGENFTTPKPSVEGSSLRDDSYAFVILDYWYEGTKYTYKGNGYHEFQIDGFTGVFSTTKDLAIGQYKIDILVGAKIGGESKIFNDAIVFEVKGGGNYPQNLSYPGIAKTTSTGATIYILKTKPGSTFSSGLPMVTNMPTRYSYKDANGLVGSQIDGITINPTTGEITADGTAINKSEYKIEVRAANADGLTAIDVIVAYDKTYFYQDPNTGLLDGGVYKSLVANCLGGPCHGSMSTRTMPSETPNFLRLNSLRDNAVKMGDVNNPGLNSFLDRMTRPYGSTGFMAPGRTPIQADIDLLKKWVTDGMPSGNYPATYTD